MRRYFVKRAELAASFFAILGITMGLSFSDARAGNEIVIAAFGDSLSAGYQLPPGDAFPVRLEKALKAKGHNVRVLNAAVSGDTTATGLARLDWAITRDVDAVIVELGANDALRGVDTVFTKATLDKIIVALKEKNVRILVTGMEASRALGEDYVTKFRALFKDLAEKHDVLYYPFFLEGVALKSEYNLPDGIHPNSKGIGVIVENILPSVEKLITQVQSQKAQ